MYFLQITVSSHTSAIKPRRWFTWRILESITDAHAINIYVNYTLFYFNSLLIKLPGYTYFLQVSKFGIFLQKSFFHLYQLVVTCIIQFVSIWINIINVFHINPKFVHMMTALCFHYIFSKQLLFLTVAFTFFSPYIPNFLCKL